MILFSSSRPHLRHHLHLKTVLTRDSKKPQKGPVSWFGLCQSNVDPLFFSKQSALRSSHIQLMPQETKRWKKSTEKQNKDSKDFWNSLSVSQSYQNSCLYKKAENKTCSWVLLSSFDANSRSTCRWACVMIWVMYFPNLRLSMLPR